jgi:protein SCO1/2
MSVAAALLLASGTVWAQFSSPLDVPPPGPAATERLPILKNAGLDPKPNGQVPLDLTFADEHGRDVRLGDFFGNRPVVLALAYYRCPMLCTQVLGGMIGALETLTFDAGRDFVVVVVSFDPGETPAMALSKKVTLTPRYGRPGGEAGMHFLTGREDAIKQLTAAVGFRYVYDPKIGQYAHPALITVLTPGGKVSRYLYGFEFPPRDLRLALVEAADGKIGSAVDQALLYCYHYDPMSGKYGVAILNVVRLAGLLTLAAIGVFLVVSLRRERRQRIAVAPTATGTR